MIDLYYNMQSSLLSVGILGILSSATFPFESYSQQNKKSEEILPKQLPNIIFFIADDMGIGDIGCYGQREIKTPNIDALAANGMQFMQHYAGATVSGPSRCVLLTGKHTGHCHIRGNKEIVEERINLIERDGYRMTYNEPIPKSETLLPEIFHQAGYQTACIGKWGYGTPLTQSECHPNNRGIDYFYGYIGHMEAHYHTPKWIWENGKRIDLDGTTYAPQLFIDKAIDFIEQQTNNSKPFFLYYATALPHAGLEIPEEERDKFDGKYQEKPFPGSHYAGQEKPRAAYAAMITRIDNDVKQLIDKLKETGEIDNTIFIFTSDNGTHKEGGHDPYYFDSNGPFRGTKRDLYEGGIRTPLLVCWPNKIPQNSVSYHVSAFWDWMPTFCELTQVPTPEGIDGISLCPELLRNGKEQVKHEYLYYEFFEEGGKQSVLKDNWKLIRLNVLTPQKTYYELYNLSSDPSELRNVAQEYPYKVKELSEIMDKARTPSSIWHFPNDNQNE